MSELAFSGALASLGYVLIVVSVFRGAPMNIATWLVWSAVNTIATMSIMASGFAWPWMNIVFMLGSFLILLLSLFRGRWKWGMVETLCTFVALAAMVLWYFAGPTAAVIASTSAMAVGGIPQLLDAYRTARGHSIVSWGLFLASCLVSIHGAEVWDVSHIFYPAVAAPLNGLMVLFILRDKMLQTKTA